VAAAVVGEPPVPVLDFLVDLFARTGAAAAVEDTPASQPAAAAPEPAPSPAARGSRRSAPDDGAGAKRSAAAAAGAGGRGKRGRAAAEAEAEVVSRDPQAAQAAAATESPVSGEMENAVLAAYVALLLGCMARADAGVRRALRERLPGRSFDGLTQMLVAFLQMHGQAGMLPVERYAGAGGRRRGEAGSQRCAACRPSATWWLRCRPTARPHSRIVARTDRQSL
jgi:hypothetical protein